MATDENKADTPASDSQQAADTKMWHKMPLVLYKGSSSRHGDGDDDDFGPTSKADTPATDSQAADTKLWQEMPLVIYKGSSSRHGDEDDDDFESMDEELSIVVRHAEGYVPLRIVRPESLENGQEKWPVLRYKGETYKRRRGRPTGPKSSKSKIEQKPALNNGNSGKSNHSEGEKDEDFKPPTPTRKRGIKGKTEQELLLVDSSSSSSDDDDDYEPGRKKKKKIPKKKQGLRRRSKPSSNNIDNEEAVCNAMKSPGPDTDDFAAINFKIVLGDGSIIGRRILPDHLRKTYYHLCQARKVDLHRHLLKQISPMLAAGMIMETANIAEGIRESSSMSLEDLVSWKKTLVSFEPLGMDVTFMCERINRLLGVLGAPSSTMREPKGYEEVKLERARAEKEVRRLESSVSALTDMLKEIDAEMEQMLESSSKKDQAVRRLATAPW